MVTLRSTSSNSATGTSITVTAPTGIQAGDLLVLMFAASNGTVGTFPSGFSRVQFSSTTGTVVQQDTYTKIATASEPASYSVTYASGESVIIMACYANTFISQAGGSGMNNINNIQQNSAASTNATGPSITSNRKNQKIICCVVSSGLVTITAPTSNPGAYTKQLQQQSASLLTAALCDVDMSNPGATGAPVATLSSSQVSVVMTADIPGSFEEGNSASVTPRESTISPSGDLTLPTSNFGSYSTFSSTDLTTEKFSSIPIEAIVGTSSIPTPSGSVTYYKNTGYYVTGAAYESWITSGAPATTSVNPNTGHTLTNVSYVKLN